MSNSIFYLSKTSFHPGIVVACLNINSLVAHTDGLVLRTILDEEGETKLNRTIGDHEFCLPGFDFVGRDRNVNGGHESGLCIYIQSNLNYKVRITIYNRKFLKI